MSPTLIIILITCGVSFYAFTNRELFDKFKFYPYRMSRNGEYVRWLGHGFLHGDPTHLIFNMLSLYFAGQAAEQIFSPAPIYYLFYLLAIVVSSIPDFIRQKNNPQFVSIGASGAVSAVMFALILFDPWATVRVFFAIPMPFILFAILYLAYSWYMSKKNLDNIGHMAHLTGALFGIAAAIIYQPMVIPHFLEQITQPRFGY